MRRLVAAWGAAVVALLSSGCVEANVDLTVRADDHVDGTIVMAVDRGFLPADPSGAAALVAEVRRRTYEGTPSGARREPYSDANYVGSRVTITQMSLLDFDRGTSGDGLKIVHQGHRFRFQGTVDTAGMAPANPRDASPAARRAAASFHVLVRVTFPGRVVSSNGTATGNTVTWRPRFGDKLLLTAEAEDGSGVDWWWPALGVLAVVAVAGAVLVRAARSRRRGAAGAA